MGTDGAPVNEDLYQDIIVTEGTRVKDDLYHGTRSLNGLGLLGTCLNRDYINYTKTIRLFLTHLFRVCQSPWIISSCGSAKSVRIIARRLTGSSVPGKVGAPSGQRDPQLTDKI